MSESVPIGLWEPVHHVATITVRMLAGPDMGRPELTLHQGDTLDVHADVGNREARENDLPLGWARLGYRITDRLHASGGQATVWRGAAPDDTAVVLRRSRRHTIYEPHRMPLGTLASLHHPALVRAIESPIEEGADRWELIEYCPDGSLAAHQAARSPAGLPADARLTPLSTDAIRDVVRALADALHYLHDQMLYVHADLKPDNVLVRPDGTFALADFSSAVSAVHPSTATDTARTAQYTPRDPLVTRAWDWAQLGFTVLTLAHGTRQPAYEYDQIDYAALDPAIDRLVQGLLVIEPDERWSFEEVQRWLRGEQVPIRGTPPSRGRRPRGAFAQLWEVACDRPEDVGALLACRWHSALELMQGPSPDPATSGETWLQWLARALLARQDPRATEVRRLAGLRIGERADPDQVLAHLVTCLDPGGVPRYGVSSARTIELTQLELSRIAGEAYNAVSDGQTDHEAILFVERLYDLRMPAMFRGAEGFAWLAWLDQEWHNAFSNTQWLLARASAGAATSRASYQDRLRAAGQPEQSVFDLQEGDWERFAHGQVSQYDTRVKAQLLRALVDSDHQQSIVEDARRVNALHGDVEHWFREITIRGQAGEYVWQEPAETLGWGAPANPGTAFAAVRNAWRRVVHFFRRH